MIISGFIPREKLQEIVKNKIEELGFKYSDYPLNSVKIVENFYPNIDLELLDFPTANLGGILFKGDVKSSIALNLKRSKKGRNFDCMHELFHYWFHPPGNRLCIEENFILQDSGIEWQANEGAAEALMPEALFIQKFKEFNGDITLLSEFFFVGELSIRYRINNLSLNKFSFTESINKTKKKYPDNYKDTYLKALGKENIRYCPECGNSDISKRASYCKICGAPLLLYKKGVFWMKYSNEIILDKNGHASICPRCNNEDVKGTDKFCKICGAILHQFCTDTYKYDFNGNIEDTEKGCDHLPDGNARYCTKCGHPTSFYEAGYLQDWKIEKARIEGDNGNIPF